MGMGILLIFRIFEHSVVVSDSYIVVFFQLSYLTLTLTHTKYHAGRRAPSWRQWGEMVEKTR